MKRVNAVQAMGLLLGKTKDGKIFKVVFTKKDGSERTMLCRRNTSKGVNGKGAKYNAMSKALFPVYDMQKKAWRTINFQTVKSFQINGIKYTVDRPKDLVLVETTTKVFRAAV